MARARRISKAHAYKSRIFTVEYDLAGMINAYGLEFVHWLADEIANGRIDARQCVDRWSADVALTNDYNFSRRVHKYAGSVEDYHLQQTEEETV